MKPHPRFETLIKCRSMYKKELVLSGDITSFQNILKLAILRNKNIDDYKVVKINEHKHLVFYNE